MTLLYLDYDGVVHPEDVIRGPRRTPVLRPPGHTLFEHAPLLEEALEPWPLVRIVLSTSWVRVLGYDRARSYLPAAPRRRVIGATFHKRFHGPTRELRELWAQSPRGVQIAVDLGRRDGQPWIALDDAVDEFSAEQRAWLVPCVGVTGLGAPEAQLRLKELLKLAHSGDVLSA